MTAYLTVATFKLRTTMPQGDVDALELSEPGFLDAQLEAGTSRINAQLRKRYAVPFSAPVPDCVLEWLTRIVTVRAYLKRGVNPSDAQFQAIMLDADAALKELQEAANGETGLYDLPETNTSTSTGIGKGGPRSYAEASPYAWANLQRATGRGQDS